MKDLYSVNGTLEVLFEMEVEAESPEHAMQLVSEGTVKPSISDYYGHGKTYAEGAEKVE